MLRGLHTKGVLIEAVIAALIYAVACYFIEISILIQILNGIFVGIFVSIIPSYWRMLYASLITTNPYDREHQYSLSVGMLWLGAIMNRMVSTWIRIVTPPELMQNDTQFIGISIYILIIAGMLQVTSLSQYDSKARDAAFLIKCVAFGGFVAFILIVLQIYGVRFL